MAVLVTKADGSKKRFADADEKRFTYRTTDAGVLRIVQIDGGKQALAQEYSPAGWLAVTGERYPAEVGSQLESVDNNPKPPVRSRMVQVL